MNHDDSISRVVREPRIVVAIKRPTVRLVRIGYKVKSMNRRFIAVLANSAVDLPRPVTPGGSPWDAACNLF